MRFFSYYIICICTDGNASALCDYVSGWQMQVIFTSKIYPKDTDSSRPHSVRTPDPDCCDPAGDWSQLWALLLTSYKVGFSLMSLHQGRKTVT